MEDNFLQSFSDLPTFYKEDLQKLVFQENVYIILAYFTNNYFITFEPVQRFIRGMFRIVVLLKNKII